MQRTDVNWILVLFEEEEMPEYQGNPKLVGTNIVDCIPQTGECPNKCAECFYNGGRFFRTLDEPWMPSFAEVLHKGLIVRVNSGHDSNFERDKVIAETMRYARKFYNTAIPRFDFPAPVVFTCNGGKDGKLKLVEPTPNLMFVRVRAVPWEMDDMRRAVEHYLRKHGIPVVLTFMRFYDGEKIPEAYKGDYEFKKHLVNEYHCPRSKMILRTMAEFRGTGVRMCGTPISSNCVDCRNCEFLYWECVRRMGK